MRPPRVIAIFLLAVIVAAGVMFAVKPAWYLRVVYPIKYESIILKHAENYNLPPALLAAVIRQESNFDPKARSGAGATGLMQLTPDTAEGIAKFTGGSRFEQKDLLDPEINVRYGSFYLRRLHRKYEGRADGYVLALAAYNAGQGKVDEWVAEDERDGDGMLDIDEIPFDETRNYVERVQELQVTYGEAYPSLRSRG